MPFILCGEAVFSAVVPHPVPRMPSRFRLSLFALLVLALSIPLRAQDTRENADFKLAVNLYNDGVNESAEAQFRAFLEKYPNSSTATDARYYLGMIQVRLKKYKDARTTFQDLALRSPDHPRAPEAWWSVAETFAAEKNWAEAATAFARIKTFYPKSQRAPEGLLRAAEAFLKVGDEDNARTVLYALQSEYPGSAPYQDAQFLLGQVLVQSGEYDRAIVEFRRMLTASLSPALRARVLIEIATVHHLLGNKDEAEARLQEVLSSGLKGAVISQARLRFGDVQFRHRQYAEAARSYRLVADDSLAETDLRRQAMQGLAECAFAGGDYVTAARTYERILSGGGESTPDLRLLDQAATAAQQVGDYAAAGRYLERLLADTASNPDRRRPLMRLARNAEYARLPNRALQWYQRYAQDYPEDPGLPFVITAMAQLTETELRDLSRAAELYRSVVDRFGSSAMGDDAQMGLARVQAALGHDEVALDACRQVRTRFAASPFARLADSLIIAIERFRPARVDQTLPALASVLALVNEKGGSASTDLALAELYLNQLRDAAGAKGFVESATRKGLQGEEAARAALLNARILTRLAQSGAGDPMKAEQSLRALIAQGGKEGEEAAWFLYQVRSEGKAPQAVEAAALEYLGGTSKARADEVRLALADALRMQGRHADAAQEYARIITSRGSDPATADAFFGRAASLVAAGKYSEAIDDIRMYERLAPQGQRIGEALDLLATVQVRIGQYGEAARTRESMVDRFSYAPLGDSARLALIAVLIDARSMDLAARQVKEELRVQARHPFTDEDLTSEFVYQDAVVAARRGESVRARSVLMDYVTRYPRGRRLGDVLYALGEMFRGEGKSSLAAFYLTLAGEVKGNTVARKAAADLFMENGRYDDAIREYTRLVDEVAPGPERVLFQSRVIVAQYRANRLAEAEVGAKAFLASHPEAEAVKEEFLLEKGKALFAQRKFSEAENLFEDVEDSDVADLAALGLHWQGRVREAQSDNSKAEALFLDVMKKYPGTMGAMESALSLGRMATRAEKWEVAANNFRLVAEKQDAPIRMVKEALDGLILAYDQLSMYDAAVEMTKRYIAAWPGDPSVFRKKVNMGVFYYQLRYFDQAVNHLQGLLAEAPPDDQAEIRYYIGESFYYKGDFEQSSVEFLKVPYLVTKKTEIDWRALSYYMAGQSYEKLGRYSLALEMYQKILALKDADPRDRAQAEKEITRVKTLIK